MNHFRIDDLQNPLSFAKQNRKQLRLHDYLLHSWIVPGQSLSFQINLHDPERTEIKKIEAASIQQDFDLPLPSVDLTPTHTFSTLHCGHSYNLNADYELLLRVKSHGIFTNFEVSIPVVVVTEAILEE
ncbi:unnamed protein product [Rotaria magnacalcarata]|uniref:Uncharacterized protein n=1 Tax=Rotaria magnacalcarata TaxID=392030 RepID=A0A819SP59_9BILA|nr:unnamed protein product [Rotaria magnacalcarata]